MKFLLDFFPLIAFFASYYLFDIYVATGVLMVTSVIQTVGNRLIAGHWEKMHLLVLALALVFGTITLLLQDPLFIKWKASIVVWLFGVAFLGRLLFGRNTLRGLLETSMGESLDAPRRLWRNLDITWGIAYMAFGFANLWVAYQLSESSWVNFKVFGLLGMTLILTLYTGVRIFPWLPEHTTDPDK